MNQVGLDARILFFRIVRDIPYRIALAEGEQDYCCATKPMILDRLLSTLGLRCRHILCSFRWEDLNLPRHLVTLTHDEIDTHEYLEVLVPETQAWLKVDPNWDIWIRSPSIPIAQWDGLHDTILAVKPLETYSPEKSANLIAEEDQADPEARSAYLKKNAKFFRELNRWLQSQRVKSL